MMLLYRNLRVASVSGMVSMLLFLSACVTQSPPSASQLMLTPAQLGVPCEACAQATLAGAMTQQEMSADHQAAADSEVLRANAQATLNSANATLNAVQTQQQNDTNVIAAQIAATAEIARANAQATLSSAGSTQSAALTADAILLTQMADLATTGAQVALNQQYKNDLAASTQTAVANIIATQGQDAVGTSQWYVDQSRQREEQRQGPITFLWVWCLPVFFVLLAGLVLWGVWRRLKIQQANQRILEEPIGRLSGQVIDLPPHQHSHTSSHLDRHGHRAEDGYEVTTPDDQVERWLEEVKDQLRASDEKEQEADNDG